MNLGNAVKIALVMKGRTQRDLAEKLGVTHTYLCKVCNQETIGMAVMTKIANELGMKVSELVALGEDK